ASNIGASLGTLLFDNGFRDRSIRQSELFREQAILAYENSIIRALSDIENALNDQYENTLQIEIQQRQAAAQARVTETTRILYQTGDATAFDLIREQQNLLQVQQRRVNNWRDGMFASISILQALGVDPLESITP
ncbi:MAG: TolC family protein, partial [Pseudomonadota bacterium]